MIPGSNKDHPGFLESFRYALEGLSLRSQLSATSRCSSSLGRSPSCWYRAEHRRVVVGTHNALHWLGALCRACEHRDRAIVDLATQEIHPLAKRAKDIAAASVFMLAIMAAIVG